MREILQGIVTILALVNPPVCMAIFAELQAGRPRGAQLADAAKTIAAMATILVVAALFGTTVLHLCGVSVHAFAVAGGSVICYIGFVMLRGGRPLAAPGEGSGTGSDQPVSLIPLILFAAGPGTITGTITLAAAHTGTKFPFTALIAVLTAAGVTWTGLILTAWFGSRLHGSGFLRETLTRFMGLIVIAMGVQIMLTGVREFFATVPGG